MFLFIVCIGRSYSITSQRMLMQCIDSLVLKVQSGVVINFEKIGPDPSPVTNESKYKKCLSFLICETYSLGYAILIKYCYNSFNQKTQY